VASRGGQSRYDGLWDYLLQLPEPVVHLSFVEIERIIGGTLPASTRQHRAWWGSEGSGTPVRNNGRGIHNRGSRAVTGTRLGPFKALAGALAAADATGRRVETCSVCASS
jgi:hypothetical protein